MKTIARRCLRSTAVLVVVLVVGFAFSAVAKAAPGDLDPTFSGDGKQTSDFGPGFSQASAIVRQPDGKIVAVGADDPCFGGVLRLASPSPATTPTARSTRASPATASRRPTSARRRRGDRGGAPGGRQDRRGRHRRHRRLRRRPLQPQRLARHELLRRRQADDRLRPAAVTGRGVAIQADGKIVVVGARPCARHDDFALARYNPNGSLDKTFSGDGKQTTDFGGNDFANGVALQATARSSRWRTGGDGAFALARYNANGSLDPTFSGDGKQTTDFGSASTGRTGWRSSRTARSSRSAAAAAAATSPSPATTPTARSTRASPATASRRPLRGLRQARTGWRSRRTARSSRSARGRRDFALARYNPNGSLDPKFSGDGKQTTDFGGLEAANGVALQARRQDRRGRRRPRRPRRLRPRPLQRQRLARHELLRRRQADDRLRRPRRGKRSGDPGGRQDRRGR